MYKLIFFLFVNFPAHLVHSQPSAISFINPTGTYILKGEKQRAGIKGNHAEIRIKLLSDSLLAMSMHCNNGYPQYLSASLIDTLLYVDNKAIHLSKADPSCQIVFAFELDGLSIKQIYTDPASTCGFEKGIIPLGFISKYSSVPPIIPRLIRR